MNKRSTSGNKLAGSCVSGSTAILVAARTYFGNLVNRAAMFHQRVFVPRHGKRIAALVSAEDAELFDAIEDRPDLEAVCKAHRDIATHGTVPLIRLVKELGL